MSKPIIITITNHKGGVGKTPTTKNLAKAFQLLGKHVAIVNMDQQSNLTKYYSPDFGFDLLEIDKPSLVDLKTLQTKDYDFILIDNPPSLGLEASRSFFVSDYLLIPTTLTIESVDGVEETIKSMKDLNQQFNLETKLLGVLVTCFDRRDRSSDQFLKDLQKIVGQKLFKTISRFSSSIKSANELKMTVQDFEKPWYRERKATNDYDSLAKEILNLIK